jgi:hypothetical protein
MPGQSHDRDAALWLRTAMGSVVLIVARCLPVYVRERKF